MVNLYSKQEADLYAVTIKGCKGYHEHQINGERLYMPCIDHKTATIVEYIENDLGERRKKPKKKYKTLKYISYLKNKALAQYSWQQCIRDMRQEYGQKTKGTEGKCKGKLLADCICASIKNR